MNASNTTQPRRRPGLEPLISDEADRELSKILLIYGIPTLVLFVAAPIACGYFDIPHSPLFKLHRIVDFLSVFIAFIPFFLAVERMKAIRMKFGRRYIQSGEWKQAAAALEPYTHFGQRFIDSSGEAHYLASIAQDRLGKRAQAQRNRDFVLNHRKSSEWAAKLREKLQSKAPSPRPSTRVRTEKLVGSDAADRGEVSPEYDKPKRSRSKKRRY